ncbi:cellulase family glycosylhydrolase [Isosphaeraceae bacterium EP7]
MRTRGLLALALLTLAPAASMAMDRIEVSGDKRGFVRVPSGESFVPWGFNYDRDSKSRLIEDYWDAEWDTVEADFREMKDLGANVVRVHLQFGRFLPEPGKPDAANLDRLARLLIVAERLGLYLDLTGLGCYHMADVPAWYDALDEAGRWSAQAEFWGAVAKVCAGSPAVFCYDLMNEPVVPGGKRAAGDWLGPAFAGKHFVQVITLDQAGRPRPEIARLWIGAMADAIRKHDKRALVTLGMVDWSLDRPGLQSGFDVDKVAVRLDFVCVHLYPEAGKLAENLKTLEAFAVGKPVVIEETFPMKCSGAEFRAFLEASKATAAGWVGFYWGETPEELAKKPDIGSAMTRGWLETFRAGPPSK